MKAGTLAGHTEIHMAQDRHSDFIQHLESKNIRLQMLEYGDYLHGASERDPSRRYMVEMIRGNFRATVSGPDGKTTELYSGPSKADGGLACLCHEALESGVQRSLFRHASTEISFHSKVSAASGSVFTDANNNRIEASGATERKYLCYDRNDNPIRSFTDPRLAQAYMSVIADADNTLVQGSSAIKGQLFQPELRQFTLTVTQKPVLTESVDKRAYMILSGTEERPNGVRQHRLPIRGDKAKALDIILRNRKIDAQHPLKLDLETIMTPQRELNQKAGVMRTSLIREVTSAKLHQMVKTRTRTEAKVA